MFSHEKNISRSLGVTLAELMITIAIVAIVTAIAIPNFTQIIRKNRLTTHINELIVFLTFARTEAIKRNEAITIRTTGAEWESGWIVFRDLDGDGNGIAQGDLNDTVLRVHEALPNNFTLRSTGINRVTYRSSGISGNGSFVLCDNSDGNNIPEANTSRLIIINIVGRVRMGADSNGNGIQEKFGGNDITSCITSPFD